MTHEPAENFCRVCGTSAGIERRIEARPEGWSYAQCGNCGTWSLNPMPDGEALGYYYNQTYTVPPEAYARRVAEHAPPILRELGERLPRRGKLLEIGCSYGFFLDAAQKDGWGTTGIELDDRAVKYGREKLLLEVLAGTLESEMQRLEPPYDAIVSFHVIEHLRDPIEFLRSCRKLLREGGVLILKTPNVASWIAKRTGAYWEWLCPPAHIHLFSSGTLDLALQRSGFEVQKIWSRRGDAHNNLFQLVWAFGRYVASRRRVASSKNGVSGTNGHRRLSDGWRANAAMTASEAIYYPLALVIDPWLEKKGLQPELVAIAATAAL
ncbi:MAG: class I SAM-dependent methyltransferase [Terriglobales bacterium]